MYQKTTLDNGLRILTAEMPHTHSVCITIFVGTGSRYETKQQAGISHFIEHLCFKGTEKRGSSREISAAIEGVGGILNGGTDKELTLYWCKVAQPHFQLALDVLTDILLNSKFDPAELEKERQVIIEEIHMGNDSPSQLSGILIDQLLWPDCALGRDIAGNQGTVSKISRKMMLDYMAQKYHPKSTVVSVAGALQHQEIVDAVTKALGNWKNEQVQAEYSPYLKQEFPRMHIEKKDTEQAHLCLAVDGLSLTHPKRFSLDLLNVILGEGMSSRLFTEIRDRLGLAYSIHSYAEHFLDTGSLIVHAGVEPKHLPVAIEAILKQLKKLKKKVPEAELAKAKEQAKGRLLLRMEDSRSVAGWMGGQEVLTQRILSTDEIIAIIDAITIDKLKEVADELLIEKRLRLAVVGPIAGYERLSELLAF